MLICDGHVHFYGCFDLAAALARLEGNLRAAAPPLTQPALLACLVERQGREFFAGRELPLRAGAYEIVAGPEPGCLEVRRRGRPAVFLVLGRQLVAAERIEVLGLACTAELSDGLPARDLLQGVREAGGVPVLPWAPGKWLGVRGRLVAELVAAAQPGTLLVGDTTLRPAGWPSPGLARACLPCVPGSDPLPLSGEERWLGAYGFCYRAEFDAGRPVTELRRVLSQPSPLLEPVGRRNSLPGVVRRLLRLKMRKPGG